MFKTMVNLLIFLLFFGLVVGTAWYLTNMYHLAVWVGALMVVGVFGLLLAIVFVRRYLLRNNERKFVQRVIAQEGSAIFSSREDNQLFIDDLEKQWENSIKRLYGSKLNGRTNPIYALPWILVIGESGAGKTSLIKNSRLSSALTDVEESAQYSGTKNCDWWFFEDAIILDTAGRYTIPVDEKRDNAEWERFLSLLAKYRKKEPLNGMVIAISAEQLLENDKDIIQTEALNIRKRINQLMVSVGAKFPVYVMVTKMDKMYGFTQFCNTFSEEHQRQAMGYLNESLNQHWDEVIAEGIDYIQSKIRFLELFAIEKGVEESKELLLFSKEFDQLTPALKDFSKIVFGDNPYQKIPMLRGLYFSSALNDGESSSQFLSDFNLSQEKKPAENRAYFISDFFKIILPNDRNIFMPIKEYLVWQRRNYKIAVFAWLLMFMPLVGIYTYAYLENIKIINDVNYIKTYDRDFQAMDLTARVVSLDKLRLDILKIEELNNNTLLPFLQYNQSKKAEKKLKELFHENFYNYLYKDFALKINNSVNKITDKTASNEVVSYIGFSIDTLNVLKQALQAKEDIEVSKRFSEWIKDLLFKEESKIDSSVSMLFVNDYIAFQKWNENSGIIKEQIEIFEDLIALIVEKKGSNLHWLVDESVSQTPTIKISDFFDGINDKALRDFPLISGSLTKKGRDNLVENITILEKEMNNSSKFQKELLSFWKWYDKIFYDRWKHFAIKFGNVSHSIKSRDKEHLLYSMTSSENPYFNFIHTMATELKAYNSKSKAPSWAELVIELDNIMSIASNIRHAKNSLLAKVGKETNQLLANAEEKVNTHIGEIDIKNAMLFNKYVEDLMKLSMVIDSKKSRVLLSEFFSTSEDQTTLSPSFSEFQNHYEQFKHSNRYYKNSSFIYKIVSGPKNYIINYSIKSMENILNREWENMVLGSIPLSTDHNLLMSLFNKDKGLVWKYVNEKLDPFVTLNQYGYHIKKVAGFELDIKPSFLRYLNSGINLLSIYKPYYNVEITTLPFDMNEKAKIESEYVTLRLTCAKNDFVLENNNYKLSKVFSWKPDSCGDTVLSFGFKNFKVTKTYKGSNGFLYFLKDFKDGTHKFTKKDFDSSVPELKEYSIEWIKLTYNIEAKGSILKLLDKTPYHIPKKVTALR